MDKRQKNNLMTTITLIVVLGQFILWIMFNETQSYNNYSNNINAT